MKNYKIMQMVGDRGRGYFSYKDIAFCIPANPMSDRGQLVIEIYESEDTASDKEGIYRG